jgi:hypothetical protein
MTSKDGEAQQTMLGWINIKLSPNEQVDREEFAVNMVTRSEDQLWLFEAVRDLNGLNNAISSMTIAVDLTNDEHLDKPNRLANLAKSQYDRFRFLENLIDLEGAILNMQTAVDLTDDGHPDKTKYLSALGGSQVCRFEHLTNSIDVANGSESRK